MTDTVPDTFYTDSAGVNIAYQIVGKGPIDLVVIPGWISNLEIYWEQPDWARWTRRLSTFARVILFDKRGTGLSDRVTDMPTLEVRMDDVRAVMDAADSKRAAVFGWSEGGSMAALFAATYPGRTTALILHGSFATQLRKPDYPWGRTAEEFQSSLDAMLKSWGTKDFALVAMAGRITTKVGDPDFEKWWGRFMRLSVGVKGAVDLARMNAGMDVRPILPAISAPTLVLRSAGDPVVEKARQLDMAARIPNSRFVEYESADHVPWLAGSDFVADEIEEFITGKRSLPEQFDRMLATVLFIDIVASTERLVALGDRSWGRLLQDHKDLVRRELIRFRGHEVDTAGDGFLASFDGPARAIRCARAIVDSVRKLGIEVRAGLHTGECEVIDGKIGGLAVHVGARIVNHALPGEVLVSNTVRDLVAGSGLSFEDRGLYELKGTGQSWHLFSAM